MNYNKIKRELERREITIKDFCRKVDITEQGLHQMIRNSSMKIDILERISEGLGVPVSFWFDEQTQETASRKQPAKISDTQRIDKLTSDLNALLKSFAGKQPQQIQS